MEAYMKVALLYTYNADIIEIPDSPKIDLEKTYEIFDEWLFDKRNNHKYWVIKKGKKFGVAKHPEAFVDWLNQNVYKDQNEKSKVIDRGVVEYDASIPTLQY